MGEGGQIVSGKWRAVGMCVLFISSRKRGEDWGIWEGRRTRFVFPGRGQRKERSGMAQAGKGSVAGWPLQSIVSLSLGGDCGRE